IVKKTPMNYLGMVTFPPARRKRFNLFSLPKPYFQVKFGFGKPPGRPKARKKSKIG
ncbi:hypothetical protein V3C99_006966, partial [Haemonchus contortus]